VRDLPLPKQDQPPPAIGLAFPVYEFMVPKIVLIWLHKLPAVKEKTPAFIIDTSGGFPCDAAGVAMTLLKKKNYDPLGVLEIPTPTAEPILNNKYYPVGWARELLDRCYTFGALIALRLRKENDTFIDLRLGRFRFPRLTRFMYDQISNGKSSSGGLIKFNRSMCEKCGACERACPMLAINLSNLTKPIKYNRCMLCATCIRVCPTNAITITYRPKAKPPSSKIAPKLRPGYILPQKFKARKHPNLNIGFFKLILIMIKARKIKSKA